jgi:hypothetical protein
VIYCVILFPGIGAKRDVISSKLKGASGGWINFKTNTWFISTNRHTTEWRDEIKPYLGIGGSLVIIRVRREWSGIKGPATEWLKRHADKF